MLAFSAIGLASRRVSAKHYVPWAAVAVTTAVALTATIQQRRTHLEEDVQEDKKQESDFDFRKKHGDPKDFWNTKEGKEFLKQIIDDTKGETTVADSIKNKMEAAKTKLKSMFDFSSSSSSEPKGKEAEGLFGMAGTFSSLVKGGEDRDDDLDALMSQARSAAQATGGITDTTGFTELLALMEETSDKIEQVLKDQFGHIDFSYFTPTALWYYLEHEDERKNASMKRLQHRFHKGVDVRTVKDLNDALMLCDLAYVDTPQELKEGLDKANIPLQLVYYQMESEPGKPSHFVAVRKGQPWWSRSLEVYIVVRGTKTIADAVTDILIDTSDYRGGKAHTGIVDSGKWLAEKQTDLLDELLEVSGKKNLKLNLIGHSLGAGAAAIAGMELRDNSAMEVNVVGFGCPALLSKELSESTAEFITTVICDSDIIPRMSGATAGNVALDIMEYDRYPKLHRDATMAIEAFAKQYPKLVTEDAKKSVLEYIDSASDRLRKKLLKPKSDERMDPVLFPPGKCVHFYRDGHSISGSIAPCDFFGEIDITRTMVDDHLIGTGYGKIFLDLMRVYHDDENFTFDDRSDE